MFIPRSQLGVGFLFISGMLLGAIGARFIHEMVLRYNGPPGPPPKEVLFEMIAGELELEPAQRESVRPVVYALNDELLSLRTQADSKIISLFEGAQGQIKPMIKEKQAAALERLVERIREHPIPEPPPLFDGPPPPPGPP